MLTAPRRGVVPYHTPPNRNITIPYLCEKKKNSVKNYLQYCTLYGGGLLGNKYFMADVVEESKQ
eukprot:scaffold1695_cov167-Amphora_coffeaeformis.AAC.8